MIYNFRNIPMFKMNIRNNRRKTSTNSESGLGNVFLMPLVLVRALGQRTYRWFVLRQERFLHTHSSSSTDIEETLKNLNIQVEQSYAVHSSPNVRLPYHLRPKPFRTVRKVYVPRRRVSTRRKSSFLRLHYQTPRRGRPVPVAPELMSTIMLKNVKSNMPKAWHRKMYSKPALEKKNYSNLSYDFTETSGKMKDYLKPAKFYQRDSTNTILIDSSLSLLTTPINNDDLPSIQQSGSNDSSEDNDSVFSVASENVSPKLLQVVASLRENSKSPLAIHPLPFTTKSRSVKSALLLSRITIPSKINLQSSFSAEEQKEYNKFTRSFEKQNNLNQLTSPNGNMIESIDDKRRSFRNIGTPCQNEQHCSNNTGRTDTTRRSCHSLIERPHQCKLSVFPTNYIFQNTSKQDNFMNNDKKYKNYSKSVLGLTQSAASNDENSYDIVEPYYDTISDSGYSTVAETSRESILGYQVCDQYLVFPSSSGDAKSKKRLPSKSCEKKIPLSDLPIARVGFNDYTKVENKLFGHYYTPDSEQEAFESKWRTKSAEELSLYSSVRILPSNSYQESHPLYLDFSERIKPFKDRNVSSLPSLCSDDAVPSISTTYSSIESNFDSTPSPSVELRQKTLNDVTFENVPKPQKSFLHSVRRLQAMKRFISRDLPAVPCDDCVMPKTQNLFSDSERSSHSLVTVADSLSTTLNKSASLLTPAQTLSNRDVNSPLSLPLTIGKSQKVLSNPLLSLPTCTATAPTSNQSPERSPPPLIVANATFFVTLSNSVPPNCDDLSSSTEDQESSSSLENVIGMFFYRNGKIIYVIFYGDFCSVLKYLIFNIIR